MSSSHRRARPRVAAAAAVIGVLSLALSVLSPTGPASAATDINHQLAEVTDDLAVASKAVTRANAALEAARTGLPPARAAAAAAAADLKVAGSESSAAAGAASRAAATSAKAQQRLRDAQSRINGMNGQIDDLVRQVYTQGPYVELAAILSAATPGEFADQLEGIRAVSRSQNKMLVDMQVAKANLALASLQAEQARVRVDAQRKVATTALNAASRAASRARTAKARVDAIVASRASALSVANAERERVKKQYAALKAEQARLRALERGPGGFTGRPTGNLTWPIPGAGVSQRVGPRIHPVYGYRSCHTGVDIHGAYGTPILAAADGKVIEVLRGGPYGLHTVISHGNGIATMYAHQSRTRVSVGDIVRQGEIIGNVGSTGWVTGPHLHWEVHVNGVPYDPLGWFGSPRRPVSCWNG